MHLLQYDRGPRRNARRTHQALDTVRGLLGDTYAMEPEQALLLLAASAAPVHETEPQLARLLSSPPEWDAVLDLSARHGVTALLHRRLRASASWEAVPERIRQTLDRHRHAMRLVQFAIARQLAELLDLAAASGLRPIVLKGAALATTAYPDATLRSMGDIDLLIAPACLDGMRTVLARLCYTQEPLYYTDAFNSERGYHFRYADSRGNRQPVEIHWDLASRLERRNRLTASMLERHTVLRRVVLLAEAPKREAQVLAPAAQLIHLATHAATEGHALGRLIWLADVTAVSRAFTGADWATTIALAGRARARTATFVVLALARNLLSAPVPEDALESLRPARLVLRALDGVLNPQVILQPVTDERRAIVKYLVVDSPATTVRLLCERFFPPPAVLRVYARDLATTDLRAAYFRHVTGIGRAALRKVIASLHAGAGNPAPEERPQRRVSVHDPGGTG